MIPRRGLLAGLGALLAAPAIIRTPGLLMPVRPALVDWKNDPAAYARWVYMSTPGGQEPSVMYDWFVRYAAANGAIVERRVHEGQIAGRGFDFVCVDEAAEVSNEGLHSVSLPERLDGANRSQRNLIFGKWLDGSGELS